MAFLNDFTINYITKTIRHTSGTVIYTLNTIFSELEDLFDDSAQMDDLISIKAVNSTEYQIINKWFIDDLSMTFIRGGSLTSVGWGAGEIIAISYDATGVGTLFVSTDISKTIVGTTTTHSGIILHFDERFTAETGVVWIRPTIPGTDTFNNVTEAFTVTSGTGAGNFTATLKGSNNISITQALTGETVYGNPNVIGTLESDTEIYVIQSNNNFPKDKIDQFWNNATHTSTDTILDFTLKIQEFGILLDKGRLNFIAHQFTRNYDNFKTIQAVGKQFPIPLSTANDVNNNSGTRTQAVSSGLFAFTLNEVVTGGATGAKGKVTTNTGSPTTSFDYFIIGNGVTDFQTTETLTGSIGGANGTANGASTIKTSGVLSVHGITVSFAGPYSVDVNGGATDYSIQINANSQPLSLVYEYLKYLTSLGVTTLLNGNEGQQYIGIDLRLDFTTITVAGTVNGDILTQAVSGASGIVVNYNAAAKYAMLRNTKGIFNITDQVTSNGTGTLSGPFTIENIIPNKTSAFGSLISGRFFGSRGSVLINELSIDANNYEVIDDAGITKAEQLSVSTLVNVKNQIGINLQNTRVLLESSDGTGDFPFRQSVSITHITTTATVTHTAHGLVTSDIVVVRNSNQLEYNGVFVITVTNANTYTYIMNSDPGINATGPVIVSGAILSGLTDANGNISKSRSFVSTTPVKGVARLSTSSPRYKSFLLSGTINNSNGLTINVRMVLDE